MTGAIKHANGMHQRFQCTFELPALIGRVIIMRRDKPLCLAALNSDSMFATVLFLVTLSPTTPQVTPFGLRKSFCGSVMTSAITLGNRHAGIRQLGECSGRHAEHQCDADHAITNRSG
jgi:hypothetical protein